MRFAKVVVAAIALCACEQKTAPRLEQQTENVEVLPPVVKGTPSLPPPPAAELPAPPLSATLTFTYDPDPMTPVSDLREITVDVDVLGATSQQLSFEFVTPAAAVFDARAAALSGNPYQRQHLRFELPVAGTLIDSSSLTGTWTARALLDDGTLAAQAGFGVHP